MSQSLRSPVFVYGALRSGTTLLHLILDAHPAIHSASEADYLFDHVTPDPSGPGGWRYDTEALATDWIFRDIVKLEVPGGCQGIDLAQRVCAALSARAPGQQLSVNIHRNAPVMAAMFPEAKIIHLLRDPRDVARSSVGMGWSGNSYYGVDHWIGTETDWDAAGIRPERVLEVRFETLISDIQGELPRICDFLGVAFDPRMLDYHEQTTYAPPDPSIAGKWREKAAPREIALIEGRLGTLLEARGYGSDAAPVQPGTIEALRLVCQHRLNRWRFKLHRYGPGLVFGRRLAKLFRCTALEARLAARQDAIRIRNLK